MTHVCIRCFRVNHEWIVNQLSQKVSALAANLRSQGINLEAVNTSDIVHGFINADSSGNLEIHYYEANESPSRSPEGVQYQKKAIVKDKNEIKTIIDSL